MQAELQALWKEQCDQLRKKKEQFATEVSGMQKKDTTVVDECFLFPFLYHSQPAARTFSAISQQIHRPEAWVRLPP